MFGIKTQALVVLELEIVVKGKNGRNYLIFTEDT